MYGKLDDEFLVPATKLQISRMDLKDQAVNLLNKIWAKLQGLPNASPVELRAFFILLTFILVVVAMAVLICTTYCCCCCCRKEKRQGANI